MAPFFALLSVVILSACAGGSVVKIEDTGALPVELDKELQKQFEVKESTEQPTLVPAQAQGSATVLAKASTAKPVAKAKKTKGAKKRGFSFLSRRPPKDPIWIGEKQVLNITYFGMSAGDFTLTALPYKEINSRKVYHVQGTAQSSKVFSVVYKLKDTIESFIDFDGLFSHRFHIVLEESKQTRNSLELYDPEKAQTFFWNRWNHHKKGYSEVKDFFPMTPFAQDSLSALYYLRSQPLTNGSVVTFPVVSEGKNWEAVVTVVRREVLDTPMGKIPAIVLKPETKYQGILKKEGDSYIWLSDDDRRLLLRLEAKVKIGKVLAILKKFEPGIQSP